MLAIHDLHGAHEGSPADIPKVIPSLHTILILMGGEAVVVKDVALYEERVSAIDNLH